MISIHAVDHPHPCLSPHAGEEEGRAAFPNTSLLYIDSLIIIRTALVETIGVAIGIGIGIDLENRAFSIPMPIPTPTPKRINNALYYETVNNNCILKAEP